MSGILNLFPARVPIGTTSYLDKNGRAQQQTVLASPEFLRALELLFIRVGGAQSMSLDDIDIMASLSSDYNAQIAELRKTIENLQIEVALLRDQSASAAGVKTYAENLAIEYSSAPSFYVPWERPGKIGSFTPNTIAGTTGTFTTLISGAGAVGTPSIYLSTESTTGFYRIGANNWGWSASGNMVLDFSATGVSTPQQITSTLATGTAPLAIASTTQVANLNVSQLEGKTWAIPDPIGATTPNTIVGSTVTATGAFGCNGAAAQTAYALGGAATDLATVIVLANNLRTMSRNNGTGS